MKLLLVFAFLALICMARSIPSSTRSQLILPDYQEVDDEIIVDDTQNDDDESTVDPDVVVDADAEEEEEEETTTTTTTTTRRPPYVPTRNRDLIPTRRPFPTRRTTSARTTTTTTTTDDDDNEEHSENTNEYDGDFKYIRDFQKYVRKIMDDIRQLVRNLTGYQFGGHTAQRQLNNQHENDD